MIPNAIIKFIMIYNPISSIFRLAETSKSFYEELNSIHFYYYYFYSKFPFLKEIIIQHQFLNFKLFLKNIYDIERKYIQYMTNINFEYVVKERIYQNLMNKISCASQYEIENHPIIKRDYIDYKKIKIKLQILKHKMRSKTQRYEIDLKAKLYDILLN